jgi:DNA polymerase (family X)
MENKQVADALDEIADLLELKDANRFRIRSYRRAARSVRNLSARLADLAEDEEASLDGIPDVGEATAAKIREILRTGSCQRLEDLRGDLPKGLTRLMQIPRIGPRKAMQLHEELGVTTLRQLERACEKREVRALDGMGPKTEENILRGIHLVQRTEGRLRRDEASEQLAPLADALNAIPSLAQWVVAGSYRRGRPTVGDLDILLRSNDRDATADALVSYDAVSEVIDRGSEKVSVRIENELRVDFRFFDAPSFGAAQLYFTGSKDHNIRLRRRAGDRDWKLNEYGLSKGDKRLAGKTEQAVYRRLDLDWIPPELREDRGEIDAAAEGRLPALVERDDLRGDLHAHTADSDGTLTIRELANAAREFGHDYLAVTDHSRRVTMAHGLDDDRLRRQADAVRDVDRDMKRFWLLAGVECDILKDGRLDLKEETLAGLDWVVAGVHYDRALSRRAMTARLVAAVSSGVVHCLGHPTGRMIGRRDEMSADWDKVFEACAENRVCIEINSQPERLDMPDHYLKRAREAGVTFAISTDAHAPEHFRALEEGVLVARRGWLEKKDVLNAQTLTQLRKTLS